MAAHSRFQKLPKAFLQFKPTPLGIALMFGMLLSVGLFFTGCDFGHIEGKLDPALVLDKSGLKGEYNGESNVFKTTLVRPEISTTIEGVRPTAAMGLEAWATLTGSPRHAILLGDIPLREDEVNGTLRSVLDAGVTPASLHNTFLMDSPRVMSLHIEATGSEERLAQAMGKIFQDLAAHRIVIEKEKSASTGSIDTSHSTLDPKVMESLLWKGEMVDGVYRLSLGRGTRLAGHTLGDSMGVTTWAAFAGNPENAVVNGDLATLENELPYVLKTLIDSRIRIVSIHSHMTQEKPKLVFVHFWGSGKVEDLARGVKDAFWLKEKFQSQ